MNRLYCFLALLVFLPWAAHADPSSSEAGFIELFNGTDFDGWSAKPGCWEVRDGAIHCTGTSKTKNWLIWRNSQPRDFILRLDGKWDAGNSGIQVRSQDLGDWQVFGYQVEVAQREKMGLWHHSLLLKEHPKRKARHLMTTAGEVAVIDEDGSRNNRMLTATSMPAKVQAHYTEGEWNTIEIEARGDTLIQRINGVEFARLIDRDREMSRREGFIALQDHGKGCAVAFRNIRLKLLPSDPPPIPDKLAVLTFDDSVASHATVVAPILKEHGFGATFFITEGFDFATNKVQYMAWKQIKGLHDDGFEIGNHTRHHRNVTGQSAEALLEDIIHIEEQCLRHGIPSPTTFCYPGYAANATVADSLRDRGYLLARVGGRRPFHPASCDPLLAPQAFDSKPESTFDEFKAAVARATDGQIPILTFHGVPDLQHPWVHTDPEQFRRYMDHLASEGFTVVALRDVARYLPGGGVRK